ncbi:MAG: ankyrin repeat domain-containing protein [Capsulimonas sp.]|uniref:ankyrin repeat domain-containing protein n=1 Tax=Capsulimonas sp. TaxID=2494211 RepID=UPI0032654C54
MGASDNNGDTALHYAAQNRWRRCIPFLIQSGADINAQNRFGETALHRAVRAGDADMIKLLEELGADSELLSHTQFTAMRLAMQAPQPALIQYYKSIGRLPPAEVTFPFILRAHSERREAIGICSSSVLARWRQSDDGIQIAAYVETSLGRLADVRQIPGTNEILLLGGQGTLEVRSWDTLELVRFVNKGCPYADCFAISADGSQLVFAPVHSMSVRIAAFPSLDLLGEYWLEEECASLAVHAETKRFAAAEINSEFGFANFAWVDTSQGQGDAGNHFLKRHAPYHPLPCFSPDGRNLAFVGEEDGSNNKSFAVLEVYDLTDDRLLWSLSTEIPSLATSKFDFGATAYSTPIFLDDQRILWGTPNGELTVYNAEDGAVLSSLLVGDGSPLYSVSVGAQGELIWMVDSQGKIAVYPMTRLADTKGIVE